MYSNVSKHKEQRGIILLIVLCVILVVVALANVILMLVTSQSKLTQHQVSRIRAYYAAQAGMNLAFDMLRRGIWTTTLPADPYTLCSSGCDINDNNIPYQVNIAIGSPGSGISETRLITIDVDYTNITP